MIKQKEVIRQTFYERRKANGYIQIKVNGIWINEHRYIVEEFIGRKLKEGETIHHINHNRMDNRIGNLFLFPNQNEHKSFENKVAQFGFTTPIFNQIKDRWNKFKQMEITA